MHRTVIPSWLDGSNKHSSLIEMSTLTVKENSHSVDSFRADEFIPFYPSTDSSTAPSSASAIEAIMP